MDKNQKVMIIAGAAAGVVLLVLVVLWRVSAGKAEDRAAELTTATADLVRCLSGDKVKLERSHALQGFDRQMVSDLPDISSTGRCLLALEVVTEKWNAYDSVWFNSTSASGDDGTPYGDKFRKAYEDFKALPLKKSSDQVFEREEKYGAVLGAGRLAFDMYEAARNMYVDEGASDEDATKASENRLRKAPNAPARAPQGRAILTIDGKLDPAKWRVIPKGTGGLTLSATNDKGEMIVAWSDDAGVSWKHAKVPPGFEGKKDVDLRVFEAPDGQRYYLIAHGQKDGAEAHIGKVTEGAVLPKPSLVPPPPAEWKRAPGGEREAVVIEDGTVAFAVWRMAEKTKEEKKAEEKERKEWEKNYADKAVQALITLAEQRRKVREALGIDEDHKRIDGIAYSTGKEVTAMDLAGYGLAGLVPGAKALALVSEGPLPAQKLGVVTIPPPGQPLGMIATAESMKPVEPDLRGAAWTQCVSSDGTTWGTTVSGNFLLGMRADGLDMVPMIALAEEGSHIGCGANVATVALPFKQNRIFANLLTIRAREVEGGKIATTAGTSRDRFNATTSSSIVPGATVLAWVARGYALYTVNVKTDNDFKAPEFLAEAGADGSKITGVQLVGLDKLMVGLVAREVCAGEGQCKTTLEIVKTEDAAQTWTVPG